MPVVVRDDDMQQDNYLVDTEERTTKGCQLRTYSLGDSLELRIIQYRLPTDVFATQWRILDDIAHGHRHQTNSQIMREMFLSSARNATNDCACPCLSCGFC